MFSFLFRKLINNKWMIISLLIGNILLIGTASSVPLYSNATMQRMLTKELEQYRLDREADPGLVEVTYAFTNTNSASIGTFETHRGETMPDMRRSFDISTVVEKESIYVQTISFIPMNPRKLNPPSRLCSITSFSAFPDHIRLTAGEMYSDEVKDGVFEAVVSNATLQNLDLLVGDTIEAVTVAYKGEPLRVRIVGVFENSEPDDLYWIKAPSTMANNLFISQKLMFEDFVYHDETFKINVVWQTIFDYQKILSHQISRYINTTQEYSEIFSSSNNSYIFSNSFLPIIASYMQKSQQLDITLWVLQVPVYILLAFFIFMVSKQILLIEQNEISVLKSRGASRKQIMGVYFMQGLLICAVSFPIGISLGLFLCKLLGSSNGFLNMVQRSALKVNLVSDAFLFAGVAVLFSLLTMLLPVVSYSRVTIVNYKRSKSGGTKKPFWKKFFLDFLALGVSGYALFSYNQQSEMYAKMANDVNSIDPLLFLSSSLFIIGLGLFFMRIYPYIIKLVFAIGKKWWSPSFYASFLKMVRSIGEEQFIMLFLVFTIATGIFDAKAARTLNLNNEDKIRHETGTDIVVRELFPDNRPQEGSFDPRDLVYQEPDFEKYLYFEEIDSVTKVYYDEVRVDFSRGRREGVTLMAVESKEFGETAWYRDDLFQTHFYDYLNALGQEPTAILLSRNFQTTYNLKAGDVITFRDSIGYTYNAPVYGFVDYWPGFLNTEKTRTSDGLITEQENWLIVANLRYMQSVVGVRPYDVWIKSNTDSNNFLYTYANENDIKFQALIDGKGMIINGRNDPMLQGTNGVLTVGFITTIIVCATGFLIFWILSIRTRVLQFGIFRAMGMPLRSVIGLLINEQIFITGVGLALGYAVGEISSRLFVPIIQVAYSASDQTIPFLIITQRDDYIKLFLIIGIMILLCMCILGVLISKIKIAQALKLGED